MSERHWRTFERVLLCFATGVSALVLFQTIRDLISN